MTTGSRWGIGIVLLVLLPWAVRAGDIIHHHIGDTITPTEAAQYNLFEDTEGLKQVDVIAHRYLARTYLLVIQTMVEDSISAREVSFNEDALDLMAWSLQHTDSVTYGQNPGELPLISVRTTGGYVASGRFEAWTGSAIIVQQDYGTDTIPLEHIEGLTVLADPDDKPFTPIVQGTNPNRSRLLFMPTGRSLKQGEGYFGVYEVLIPMAHVGLGYNISVGGGIFPVITSTFNIGYLSAQVGLVNREESALAVGNLTILASSDDETNSVGINYLAWTHGPPERSFSGGLGFGFTPDGVEETPFIVIGGQYQMSRRTALVTENWIIPGMDVPTVSLGLRWFNESISADFGFFRPLVGDGYFAIPWVDFVIHFGNGE